MDIIRELKFSDFPSQRKSTVSSDWLGRWWVCKRAPEGFMPGHATGCLTCGTIGNHLGLDWRHWRRWWNGKSWAVHPGSLAFSFPSLLVPFSPRLIVICLPLGHVFVMMHVAILLVPVPILRLIHGTYPFVFPFTIPWVGLIDFWEWVGRIIGVLPGSWTGWGIVPLGGGQVWCLYHWGWSIFQSNLRYGNWGW